MSSNLPLFLWLCQEIISRQMNSVFKELLSRQPPLQPSALSAPVAPVPSSSSSSSLAQNAPAVKKGFGLRKTSAFPSGGLRWRRDNDGIFVWQLDDYCAEAFQAFSEDLIFSFLFFFFLNFGPVNNSSVCHLIVLLVLVPCSCASSVSVFQLVLFRCFVFSSGRLRSPSFVLFFFYGVCRIKDLASPVISPTSGNDSEWNWSLINTNCP